MNQNETLKRSVDDIAKEVRRTKETNEEARTSVIILSLITFLLSSRSHSRVIRKQISANPEVKW